MLDVERRVLGEEHPDTLNGMNCLAATYLREGKYDATEALFTKLVEIERRTFGEEHPNTVTAMSNLGVLYQYQGKFAQAETLLTRVLELRRDAQGEEHPYTLTAMNVLAQIYRAQGKYPQAESLLSKVVSGRRRVLGEEHPDTGSVLSSLGVLWLEQREYAKAEALLRTAVDTFEKVTPNTWTLYNGQCMLSTSLAGQKKYPEAERLLLSGYEGMLQRESTIPAARKIKLKQAGNWIVDLYQDWGKPDKAAEWRQKLRMKQTPPAANIAGSSVQVPR
jgi:non-specific serine/threonine protein kinase/serine/threonine-protein kinase